MTTSTIEPKFRTITLTGRRPVKINEAEWPTLAQGVWTDHDGTIREQANRTWTLSLRVRQHADGRAIVYATYEYDTQFQGEPDYACRVGRLVDAGADLPTIITEVGRLMDDRLEDLADRPAEGRQHVRDVVADAIADLPAETI